MSKLATLAALLVALLALAEATTYTTVTTTTVDEETTNPQSCQKQQMSHCRMYLQCQQGGRGRSHHESLRMVVNTRCEERHLEQCCDQLSNISEECRCKAINRMVMEQGTEQMQGMMQQARDLPRRCNMQPQKCDMRALWF